MRLSLLVAFACAASCGSANLTTGGTGGGAVQPMDAGSSGGGAAAGGRAGGTGGGTVTGGGAGGGTTGGGAAGGATAGGATGGGGTTGGGTTGGGGSAGGSGGGAAGCTPSSCPSGCCLNGTCQPGTQPLACGTNGIACAQCMTNEACTNQTCGFDPQSMWRVHPTRATITSSKPSGAGWDSFGGDPDPYVDLYCPATASGVTDSTSTASDTLAPSWSDGE